MCLKESQQGWMGKKSSANILSALQPALVPEHLLVPYTKPYTWKDQKITTVRCPSKKTKETLGDLDYWRATPKENQLSFGAAV